MQFLSRAMRCDPCLQTSSVFLCQRRTHVASTTTTCSLNHTIVLKLLCGCCMACAMLSMSRAYQKLGRVVKSIACLRSPTAASVVFSANSAANSSDEELTLVFMCFCKIDERLVEFTSVSRPVALLPLVYWPSTVFLEMQQSKNLRLTAFSYQT
jgi:hypothetical protein